MLLGKTTIATLEERRVVLRLLGRLPALPEAFVSVIPRGARDTDPQVAAIAKRLLERE